MILLNKDLFRNEKEQILYETLFEILEQCDSENMGAIDILESIRQTIHHTFTHLDDLEDEIDDSNSTRLYID